MPFEVVYSKSSKLLQLKHNYNSKLLYGDNYGYLSGLNPVMTSHLKKKSLFLKRKINFKNDDFILDIGSNDGTFINFFNGPNIYAIDPAIKKLKKYYKKKVNKLPFVLNVTMAGEPPKKKRGRPRILDTDDDFDQPPCDIEEKNKIGK